MSRQAFHTVDVLRLDVERDPLPGEYRNLVSNPSGAEGGWSWVTPVSQSVLGGAVVDGIQALRYVTGSVVAPASNYFYSEPFAVTGGHYARVSFRPLRSPYGNGRALFYYYTAGGAFISQVVAATAVGTWQGPNSAIQSGAFQIPANAASMAVGFEVGGQSGYPYVYGGSEFALHDVKVVTAATSAAVAAITSDSIGERWVNVLGSAHEIRLDRPALDLGTMHATILDSALDPALAPTLRKGRRCQLMALDGTTGTFSPIGGAMRILDATVTYDLKRRRAADPKHARITLSAVDRTSALASASRPEGVALIRDLPYVLEGAGVPWIVDGNSNQIATATVASTNDNATAVDQVALTRDTTLGYAWVSRFGVLNAWSSLPDPEVELISNGGFETNTTGWQIMFVGASATLGRTAGGSYAGTAHARVIVQAGCTQARIFPTARLDVKPGTSYRFSAASQALQTPRKIPLYVDWYDAAGTYLSTSGDDFNAATSTNALAWQVYTRDVIAPPGAAKAEPVLCVGDTSTAMGLEQHNWDAISFKSTSPLRTLTESDYAELDLSYDPARVINSIDFKWRVLNTYTGATDEYHLTGYEDAASIATHGRMHKTFTIHGASANAAAIAAAVFARSAQPTITPTGVQVVALKSAADVTARAFVDLYDLTRVVNASKGISAKVRVTGITHLITTDKWVIQERYAAPNGVAAPQVQPPVQNGDPTGPPFAMAVYTPATGGVAASWVDVGSWTVTEASQVTNAGAVFTIARPGRYRLSATLVFDASGTAGAFRAGKFVVDGIDTPYHSAAGHGTAAYATVEMDRTMRLNAGSTVKVQAIAAALTNLLGGLSGHGQTRVEIQFLGD